MYNQRPKTDEEKAASAAAYEASRAAEQLKFKELREVYQLLALDIALELNATWEGDGDTETDKYLSAHNIGHQLIKTEAGHLIHFRFNGDGKNRLSIWGSYGQYANGQHIKSRFMPQFLKTKAEAEAKRAADDKAILWAVSKAQFMIAHFGYWVDGKPRDYDLSEIKNSSFKIHAMDLPTLEISGSYRRMWTTYGTFIKTEEQLFEILELLTNKRIGKGRAAYRRSPRQQWKRQAASSAPTKSSQAATAALLYV